MFFDTNRFCDIVIRLSQGDSTTKSSVNRFDGGYDRALILRDPSSRRRRCQIVYLPLIGEFCIRSRV